MKIIVVSDTHGQHDKLGTLSGDVLIHCGDMFNLGDEDQKHLRRIDAWFGRQDFELIICTGGNHDFVLEAALRSNAAPFDNAIYLQDQRHTHDGVVFYGAPWTPFLSTHAFYASDTDLYDRWSRIPEDTDVLVTHTPPFSILDQSSRGMVLGCKHLANAIERVTPTIHCFGHVHAGAGLLDTGTTVFVNASSVNSDLDLIQEPVVVEI